MAVQYPDKTDIWYQIFDLYKLDREGTVIELCPGEDPKVMKALCRHRFRGTALVVDARASSLDALEAEILSGGEIPFQLHKLPASLQNIVQDPSFNGSCTNLFGNHLIDDLMSFEYCSLTGGDYERMYPDVDYSRSIWDEISKCEDEYRQFAVSLLIEVVTKVSPSGIVSFSQYPSKFELKNGFEDETRICTETLKILAEELGTLGYADISDRSGKIFEPNDTIKPEHWVVLARH